MTGRGADAQREEGVRGVGRAAGERGAEGVSEVRGVVRADDEEARRGVIGRATLLRSSDEAGFGRRRWVRQEPHPPSGLPADGVDKKFHAVGQTAHASGTRGDARGVRGQSVHQLAERGFGEGQIVGHGGQENG
jgi:hypothetical protein